MSVEKSLIEGWQRLSKITDDRSTRLSEVPEGLLNFYRLHSIKIDTINIPSAISIFSTELGKELKGKAFRSGKINFYGATANNLREFSFLEKILTNDFERSFFCNLAFSNIGSFIIPKKVQEKKSIAVEVFAEWVGARESIPGLTLMSAIQYTSAFFSWTLGNPASLCSRIPLVVVSNDHSPYQVAFAQAARYLRIPALYIQHAEVTDHFPPLYFDINVLHNERSLDVYKSIGSVPGRSFIVPRWDGAFNYDRLTRCLESEVVVALYLTANYLKDKLELLVNAILSNVKVKQLYIKPHPRTPNSEIQELNILYDGRVFSKLNALPDVAVVQNSSVVTELLHQGVKVFHIPGFDWLPGDYYGFVKDGICDAVTVPELTSDFWNKTIYDEAWRNIYRKLNPSVSDDADEEEKALRKHIFNVVKNREKEVNIRLTDEVRRIYDWLDYIKAQPSVSNTVEFFLSYLGICPARVFATKKECFFNDKTLINELFVILDGAHQERVARLVDIYNSVISAEVKSVVTVFIRLKAIEWTYRDLSDSLIYDYYKVTKAENLDRSAMGKLENVFLTSLLRKGNCNQIIEFFSVSKVVKLEKLHVSKRIAIQKIFKTASHKNRDAANYLPRIFDGLTEFDQLKLKVFGQSDGRALVNHTTVMKQFSELSNSSVSSEFNRFALPIYEKYQNQMVFMDVRWCSSQRELLLNIISEKIKTKTPWSFVRMSEGEGYLFQNLSTFFTTADILNRERHWWGRTLNSELRSNICTANRNSINSADLIGIPAVYRFLRDTAYNAQTLSGNLINRGLLNVLSGINKLENKSALYTEEKANIPLFSDFSVIKELCSLADRVVFVCSIKPSIIENKLGGIVDVITIPTHYRTSDNALYETSDKILPEMIEEIVLEVEGKVSPGVLLLVSAGVSGKCILSKGKECGAVSLDVGGALDHWFKTDALAY
jgi:hypothetical protein